MFQDTTDSFNPMFSKLKHGTQFFPLNICGSDRIPIWECQCGEMFITSSHSGCYVIEGLCIFHITQELQDKWAQYKEDKEDRC